MPVNDVVDINDDDDVDDNGVDDGVGFDIIIIGDITPIGAVVVDINKPDVIFVVVVDDDDKVDADDDDAQPKSFTVGVDGIDDDDVVLFCAAIFDQDIPPFDVAFDIVVELFINLAAVIGLLLLEFEEHIVSIDCDGGAD